MRYRNTLPRLVNMQKRLLETVIENYDWSRVLKIYARENAFLYLDPPYHLTTTATRLNVSYHGHDMSNEDHEKLVGTISNLPGMFLVSNYDSPIYNQLSAKHGWKKVEIMHKTTATSNTKKGGKNTARVECLWLNNSLQKSLLNIPLFEFSNG